MKATPVIKAPEAAKNASEEKPASEPLPVISPAAEPKKTCCGGCDKNPAAQRSGCGGKG